MKSLSLSLALLAALVAPAAAQQMGSANRNAPTMDVGIKFHTGAKLEISYTSLNWAQGKFMENAKNERFQTMLNDNAKQNPLGKVELSADMTIGGKTVAAGAYGLHFLLSKDGQWLLTFSHKNDAGEVALIQWPLELVDGTMKMTRLTIGISAGDDVTACNLHLLFGEKWVVVPASLVATEKKG